MRLEGKRALVTGAGSGIGRETALTFARAGAAVAAADINREAAEATAGEIRTSGGATVAIHADVADAASVAEMVAAAERALGGLDVLFNNAGVVLPEDEGPVETPIEVWERTLAVNLTGVFLCCKYGIPALERAGGGSIINVASMVAHIGSAVPQIAYCASKGGVVALSREIAIQYARSNIRVNALAPGPIETPLSRAFFDTPDKLERRRVHMPMGRFGQVHEVARAALFLASDESSYMTAVSLLVDGGITAAYITPE
jgi:NAD(P)-dependent dehydrogenase (short-subunit alcohol dehydrogenase family)